MAAPPTEPERRARALRPWIVPALRHFYAGYRHPVEFSLLVCLAIALPMFEGPKNYLLGLYAIVWYSNRTRGGRSRAAFGGRFGAWDALLLTLLGTALLGAAFAGLDRHEWTASVDTLRMVAVMWLLMRSGYGPREWLHLHIWVQASVVGACLWALGALAYPHDYEGIQLNSVGHVNQSVIYIVICLGALLGGIAAYWRQMTLAWRAAAIGALIVELVALVAAGSRAGAATAIVGAVAFGLLWVRRSRAPLAWTAVAIAAFAALILTFDTDMRRKQEFALDSPHPLLNERYPIWEQAVLAWRAHPAFGVGGDNFGEITAERAGAWSRAEGARYDATTFVRSSHAHSLYLNTLAEHGLVGMAALIAFGAAWVRSLARGKPAMTDPPIAWLAWSGAASALVVTVGLGVFNTTLHDEHGLLALMMLGIWQGYRRDHPC